MNPVINLANTLRSQYANGTDSDEFDLELQVQVAIAIASNLKVPAVAEGDAGSAWNKEHRAKVRQLIDELNEVYLVDVSMMNNLVRKNFETAFNLVHVPAKAIDVLNLIVQSSAPELLGNDAVVIRAATASALTGVMGCVDSYFGQLAHAEETTEE